jgi:hypothetical protein
METKMQIMMATLSFALVMWVEAASAQSRTYSVSVSVQEDLMKTHR